MFFAFSLMSAQIAYMSNRAYAFQPFLWDQTSSLPTVTENEGRSWRSAVIPLNAFIAGPAAGGSYGTTHDGKQIAPRGVNYDWFNNVCPWHRRVHVKVQDVRKTFGLEEGSDSPSGKQILEAFGQTLAALNDSCVVVGGDHVFTFQ